MPRYRYTCYEGDDWFKLSEGETEARLASYEIKSHDDNIRYLEGETVICPAIQRSSGLIEACLRHSHSASINPYNDTCGFLTETRFISRRHALLLAEKNGQLNERAIRAIQGTDISFSGYLDTTWVNFTQTSLDKGEGIASELNGALVLELARKKKLEEALNPKEESPESKRPSIRAMTTKEFVDKMGKAHIGLKHNGLKRNIPHHHYH